MHLLDRLLGHDYWSTNRILHEARDLSHEDFTRPLPEGWGSLGANLTHHIWVVGMWTAQMSGQPISPRPDGSLTHAELVELHNRNHAAFREVARTIYMEDRQDELFVDHHCNPEFLGATLNQFIHHNIEHRYQDREMLKLLGVEDIWEGDPQGWEWTLRNPT